MLKPQQIEKLNHILDWSEKNSFAIALIIFNLGILCMVYGAYDILYMKQMIIEIACIYLSIRLYQKYRSDIDSTASHKVKFKFLERNQLGILFGCLLLLGVVVGIVADLIVLSHL